MGNPSFTQNADVAIDELLAGGPVKTRTVTLTDLNTQGALTRGAVLGMVTAGELYGRSESGAVDGSEVPRAVLAKDADPSGGDIQGLIYDAADLNETKLSFGTGHDADSVREDLRAVGIHLKDPLPA